VEHNKSDQSFSLLTLLLTHAYAHICSNCRALKLYFCGYLDNYIASFANDSFHDKNFQKMYTVHVQNSNYDELLKGISQLLYFYTSDF